MLKINISIIMLPLELPSVYISKMVQQLLQIFYHHSLLSYNIHLLFAQLCNETDNLPSDIHQLGRSDHMDDVNEPSSTVKIVEESNTDINDEAHVARLPIGTVIVIIIAIICVLTIFLVTLGIVCCLLKSGHLDKYSPSRNKNNDTELQNMQPLESARLCECKTEGES